MSQSARARTDAPVLRDNRLIRHNKCAEKVVPERCRYSEIAWRLRIVVACVTYLGPVQQRTGKPKMIVSDNGTELTSNAMLKWAAENGVEWPYIASGKPQQNGLIAR